MRRFLTVPLAMSLALLLAGCGSAPEPATDERSDADFMDWTDLDGQLQRGQLYVNNKWFGDFDRDLPHLYRTRARFDAPWDSLGADAFAGCSDAERDWRRREAEQRVRLAFLAVSDRGSRISFNRLAERQSIGPLVNIDRVTLRALGHLHTAVGTDPGNAAAWYHLAYFSNVVGDDECAARARSRFLALADPPDPRRARLILDEAWHLRDAGRFEAAAVWLDGHQPELPRHTDSRHQLAAATEADLVRALCLAEQGDGNGVRLLLDRLPTIRVRDRHGWRDSDILDIWVNAWLALRQDDPDLAAFHLQYRPAMRVPAGIASRLWQDLGLINEELGRPDRASLFWGRGYITRPYLGFYPLTVTRGRGDVMGQPDTDQPFSVAFRTFYAGGSLWSYAATRVLLCQLHDEDTDPDLWQRTYACLETCIRRGINAPRARLLRARLDLQRGDREAAAADLHHASLEGLTDRSTEADVAFLRGVVLLNDNQLEASLVPLRRCVELEPDHVRGWQALAVAHSYLDHDADALSAYARVERLQPRDGVNYFNRGLLHLQHGRREAAEADLAQAAQLLADNGHVIELLQAVASGRDVTVDRTPQPIRLVASSDEVARARALDDLVAIESIDQAVDDMLGDTPEERERWRELLERRYGEDADAANRLRLAEVRRRDGDHDGVVALLAPDWPTRLSLAEHALLLDADRALGSVDRAAAIAAGEVPPRCLDVPVLVRATVILLDHGRTDAARLTFARAEALAPDEPALRDLRSRLP